MSKTLLIARWEFLATVTRRAYIFTVVGMPLLFGLISAIPLLSTRRGHPFRRRARGAGRSGGHRRSSARRAARL